MSATKEHAILFVPPGWLLAGTVEEGPEYFTMTDAVWCETVEAGSSIFSLATAKDPAKVITSSWPLPDGTRVRRDSIAFLAPIPRDVRALAHAAEIAAVRGSK